MQSAVAGINVANVVLRSELKLCVYVCVCVCVSVCVCSYLNHALAAIVIYFFWPVHRCDTW